jgi:hypothetical protein
MVNQPPEEISKELGAQIKLIWGPEGQAFLKACLSQERSPSPYFVGAG